MHPKFPRANQLSRSVIGVAIEVHRHVGAGLLESIYERCLLHELHLRQIPARHEVVVPVDYKGCQFDQQLRVDIYVDDCLVVELKAAIQVLPIHIAQLFSYMKLLHAPLGLLINFHEVTLSDGVHRLMLPGADGRSFLNRSKPT